MGRLEIVVFLVLITNCSGQPHTCSPDRIIPKVQCGWGPASDKCPAGSTCVQGHGTLRGYCCKKKDIPTPPAKKGYQSLIKGLCASPLMHGGYLLTCTPRGASRTCPTCFTCVPLLGTFLGLCCEDRSSCAGYPMGMPPMSTDDSFENHPKKHTLPKDFITHEKYAPPKGKIPSKDSKPSIDYKPSKEYHPSKEYAPPKKYPPPKEYPTPKEYTHPKLYTPPIEGDSQGPESLIEGLVGGYHDLSGIPGGETRWQKQKKMEKDFGKPGIHEFDNRKKGGPIKPSPDMHKMPSDRSDYSFPKKHDIGPEKKYFDEQPKKLPFSKKEDYEIHGIPVINSKHDYTELKPKVIPTDKDIGKKSGGSIHPKHINIPPKIIQSQKDSSHKKIQQHKSITPYTANVPKLDKSKDKDSKVVKLIHSHSDKTKLVMVKHKIPDVSHKDVAQPKKRPPIKKPSPKDKKSESHKKVNMAQTGIVKKVIQIPQKSAMESKSIIHIEMMTDQEKSDHDNKGVADLVKSATDKHVPPPVLPKKADVKPTPVKTDTSQDGILDTVQHDSVVPTTMYMPTQLVRSSLPQENGYQQINSSNGAVPFMMPTNDGPEETNNDEYIGNPVSPNDADYNLNMLNQLGITQISPGRFQMPPGRRPSTVNTRRGQFTGDINVGAVSRGDPCGGPTPVALCLGPDNTQCGVGYYCVPVGPRFGVCCPNSQTSRMGVSPLPASGAAYNPCGNSVPVSRCLGPINLRCAAGSRCVQVDAINGVCCLEGQQNTGINNIQPGIMSGSGNSVDDPCGSGIPPESMCMGPLNLQCSAGSRCIQVDDRFGVCCPQRSGVGMRSTAMQQSNTMPGRFIPSARGQPFTLSRSSSFGQSRVPGIPGSGQIG